MLCGGQVGYRISKQGCKRKLQSVSPWFLSLFLVVDGGGKKRNDVDITFGLPVASVDRMSPSVYWQLDPWFDLSAVCGIVAMWCILVMDRRSG